MSEEDTADKPYEPTQKKLDEARKKGDIARSVDLATAASYGGFVVTAAALGAISFERLGTLLAELLGGSHALVRIGDPLLGVLIVETAAVAAPWFLGPAALALLAIVAQRGLVFAPSKLVPKLSRVSPISIAKQKFGRSGLFEFAKSFTKLAIYSTALGVYLTVQMPRIVGTIGLEPGMVAAELGRLTLGLTTIVLLVAICLGVLDAVFQHAEHLRRNRMSHKEMMDELKQSEGDPHFKQHRRQRGMEIALNSMLKDVPKADVVIVNPTHFAVALKWNRSSPGAPVCVAKGVDEIAARIREIASENGIPIHSDPPTARALHASVGLGEQIAPEHYAPVAAAIRFAELVRRKAKGRSRS